VSRLLAAPRDAARAALLRAFRAWAGVPSGPLGWISTRTVFLPPGPMYQEMGDRLQLRADDELLDVACGSGAFLVQQAGHVHRVAGIDLSDIQIALARRHLGERIAAGTAEVVHGDAGTLPWPAESFTAVTCMAAFEAFPDPAQVLAEMFRVLRPGGRVVLNIGEQVAPGTQTHRAWGEIWVWAEDDVRRMVNDAGFTDVTIKYVPAWGNDPVSKLLARLDGPLGGDLRLVRAIKQ
jgi:SAM-dependent methyltransferase